MISITVQKKLRKEQGFPAHRKAELRTLDRAHPNSLKTIERSERESKIRSRSVSSTRRGFQKLSKTVRSRNQRETEFGARSRSSRPSSSSGNS